MKILHQPEADPHDCGRGLWRLGDRPIETVVACVCGRRWECISPTFWSYLTFKELKPVGYNRLKVWRSRGHVTADWDDVPGEETS